MTAALLFVNTSTLSGNVGGAIWNEAKGAVSTQVSLRACTLTGNTAGALGGAAVRCDGGPNTFANAFLNNCTLSGNDIYARSDTDTNGTMCTISARELHLEGLTADQRWLRSNPVIW